MILRIAALVIALAIGTLIGTCAVVAVLKTSIGQTVVAYVLVMML